MSKSPSMFDENPWFLFKPGGRWKEQQLFFENGGVVAALYDALKLADDMDTTPPKWAIAGAMRIIADRMKSGATIGLGSSGNEKTKYQRAMIDFYRLQAFAQVRNEGVPLADAYAMASERLQGTFAQGAEYAVEKSVKRCRKELKNPELCYKYYQAMKEARELTGTAKLNLQGGSKKSGKK
jgi:hypothetical protein